MSGSRFLLLGSHDNEEAVRTKRPDSSRKKLQVQQDSNWVNAILGCYNKDVGGDKGWRTVFSILRSMKFLISKIAKICSLKILSMGLSYSKSISCRRHFSFA
jgi:hypothetical protein